MPNAEITAASRRGLTDVQGEVRVLYPEDGVLRVRVRQLGFRYVDRTFRRDPSSRSEEDTAVVALVRMGFALPQVVVRAERRCQDGGEPARVALSQASMELLRFGAEQFENFRRAYPFDLTHGAAHVRRRRPGGTATEGGGGHDRVERVGRSVHPWEGGGGSGSRRVLRAAAVRLRARRLGVLGPTLLHRARRASRATAGVSSASTSHRRSTSTTPTGKGSAWLDSARSVLARVDFRLTNLRRLVGPQQFEGYTVFSTPTPYIAMPDSTVASWTTGVPRDRTGESRRSREGRRW